MGPKRPTRAKKPSEKATKAAAAPKVARKGSHTQAAQRGGRSTRSQRKRVRWATPVETNAPLAARPPAQASLAESPAPATILNTTKILLIIPSSLPPLVVPAP
jgi:hypothetical protein